ncbi:DEAD/DEAH box helicase [Methanosarcina sp. KYL-1]|uniref:DEAD/DEAH box helicase n=1 Tax=Methanosarcina sp. KYL-1 TaxID=2602068 RepID=UPI0021014E9A|nr:DEAD/DEAH box helicase [Methanosarcina sp. KYL-1]MCQ1537343.1 DEAD/DEAH box helicase [Methanosarcina sp. KYL-1]
MTLWVLSYAEKSKVTVLTIQDRMRQPTSVAELVIKESYKGPRPHKIRLLSAKNKKEEFLPPQKFIELLRSANRIMIADGGDPENEAAFLKMLEGFQLDADRVKVCRHCLLNKRFNFVNNKSIKFHNELICMECAKEELQRGIRSADGNYGEKSVDFLEKVLEKTRDLDRTLRMLTPERLDPEFTRYDTIKTNPSASSVRIKNLPLVKKFKDMLLQKSETLLPVQALSVEAGLLEGKDQFVVSATATGKTLIGEMAGVQNILNKKGKMLYLVPLVALANQKYDQFTERYGKLGLTTSIKIGAILIKTPQRVKMQTSPNADIIVGTYEGVDHMLRSGNADFLGKIGTVVIDEVHILEDLERGHRLDGVIGRLRYIAPEAQFIYLSATVANPAAYAKKLGAQLIRYEHRPVPIDRHLLFCQESEKSRLITQLAKDEYSMLSSKKHRGQTIVFTNSRRNCHRLAGALSIQASPYHAGLSQYERKKVETLFGTGQLPVVVTTAALAAGVDFPASQVIFESLAMGIDWISVQDFLQMSGRAGRPDYHDRGVVVLMPVPGKSYAGSQSDTEEEVAIRLLQGEMLSAGVEYGEAEQLEEILASVAVTNSMQDLRKIHGLMFGSYDLEKLVSRLQSYRFLEKKGNKIALTRFGKIVAAHFLPVSKAFLIRDAVLAENNPLNIVTNLEFFDAAYFKYANQIGSSLHVNMPSRVFQGAGLDIIFDGESLSLLDAKIQNLMLSFAGDFLSCTCRDSPYCGCAEQKFSEKIIRLRTEGLDPSRIIKRFEDSYGITAYQGDVFGYLDNAVRNLDAVELIARVHSRKEIAEEARHLRKKVQG